MTTLPTVQIQGKKYVLVNDRLKHFRKIYPNYSLETEIVSANENHALMRAVIRDEKGTLLATGTAFEKAGDGFINKGSHIENCETSAWGRALANLGIGIDETVCSADELTNALQVKPKEPAKKREDSDKCSTGDVVRISSLCNETGTDLKKLYAHFKVGAAPTKEQAVAMIASLEKKLKEQLDTQAKND